jgi:hypothetical protein
MFSAVDRTHARAPWAMVAISMTNKNVDRIKMGTTALFLSRRTKFIGDGAVRPLRFSFLLAVSVDVCPTAKIRSFTKMRRKSRRRSTAKSKGQCWVTAVEKSFVRNPTWWYSYFTAVLVH